MAKKLKIALTIVIFCSYMFSEGLKYCGAVSDSNVTFMSEWVMGVTSAIYVYGDYAYVGCEKGVDIVDVSDIGNPALVDQIVLLHSVDHITGGGSYLYVSSCDSGIYIYDISLSFVPELLDVVRCGGVRKVVISEGRLFAICSDSVIRVFDIGNQYECICEYDSPGQVVDVVIRDTLMFIADGKGGLSIVDISDVSNPVLKGNYHHESLTACLVAVSGNYAYVGSEETPPIWVFDVSSVESPLFVKSLCLPDSICEVDFSISGLQLYKQFLVAVGSSYISGRKEGSVMLVYDVGNVADTAVVVSCIRYDGEGGGIYLKDNLLFVVDNSTELLIFDLSRPDSVALRSSYCFGGSITRILLYNDFAYVLWEGKVWAENGFLIFDMADVESPMEVGFYKSSRGKIEDLGVSGNFAYVIYRRDKVLSIVDVSVPLKPEVAGEFSSDAMDLVTDVEAIGENYLCILYINLSHQTTMAILDVSNPLFPLPVKEICYEGYGKGLYYKNNRLCVVVTNDILESYVYFYNLLSPVNPVSICYLHDSALKFDRLFFSGEHFFVVDSNRVKIMELCESDTVQLLGEWGTDVEINDVSFQDGYLYLVEKAKGLSVVDISNLGLVGYYHNGRGGLVCSKGNHIVLGQGSSLVILRNDFITSVCDDGGGYSFRLYQNYPNPFNLMTTIGFDLPVSGEVLLSVYNLSGQRVMEREFGLRKRGYNEVILDMKSLASGIYFYEVRSGKYKAVGKMVLLK